MFKVIENSSSAPTINTKDKRKKWPSGFAWKSLFGCSQFYLSLFITPLLCPYFRNQSRCLLNSFIPFVSIVIWVTFSICLHSCHITDHFSHPKWTDWILRKSHLFKSITDCFLKIPKTLHYLWLRGYRNRKMLCKNGFHLKRLLLLVVVFKHPTQPCGVI